MEVFQNFMKICLLSTIFHIIGIHASVHSDSFCNSVDYMSRFQLKYYDTLCKSNAEIFSGSWTVTSSDLDHALGYHHLTNSSEETPTYKFCVETDHGLTDTMLYHRNIYAKSTFRPGCFVPETCHVLSLSGIVKILNKYIFKESRRKILFIGDSLNGQRYVAANCRIEELLWHQAINLGMIVDNTLLRGVLCHPRCLNESDFLSGSTSPQSPSSGKCCECT